MNNDSIQIEALIRKLPWWLRLIAGKKLRNYFLKGTFDKGIVCYGLEYTFFYVCILIVGALDFIPANIVGISWERWTYNDFKIGIWFMVFFGLWLIYSFVPIVRFYNYCQKACKEYCGRTAGQQEKYITAFKTARYSYYRGIG
jgi:hypothetical protein